MPKDSVIGDSVIGDHGIGASSKRREDVRFLTGRGKFTADIQLHGQCFAAFARSNMAHARIV